MDAASRLVQALHAAGAAADARGVLDALWLATWLPRPEARAVPREPIGAPPPPQQQRVDPGTGAQTDGRRADAGARRVEVVLDGAAAPPGWRLYARSEEGSDGEGPHARVVRVPSAPALRDGGALARALRPLSRWRRSTRRFMLDEDATVDTFARVGALLPCWQAQRERWFDALLLVEESASLPLWLSSVKELETLLARRVGLRSFRRFGLQSHDGALRARGNTGALHDPVHLIEGEAPLVLLASDGSSRAWRDGRMAALVQRLGRQATVGVLQLLPPRLWPNTALGAAVLQVSSPRAGAPQREQRVHLPDWADELPPRVVVAAVVALQPAAAEHWARMVMGRADARSPAGLLALQPAVPVPATDEPLPAAPVLLARLRSVAGARVLQVAVYLSAAAPLSLAVVRVVQQVMQPQWSAEDLPLLLLSGLLQRRPQPAGAPDGGGGDDLVLFDFAPGARDALQRLLLRHEAERVQQAVAAYIVERAGLPASFTALLADPEGDLLLPAWARPFAELRGQLQRLFGPTSGVGAEGPRVVQETFVAAGVTLRQEAAGLRGVQALAWSPDGQRLAVRDDGGVWTFGASGRGDGDGDPWVAEPVPLDAPLNLLVIEGWGLPEAGRKQFVAGLRAGCQGGVRGEVVLREHDLAHTRQVTPSGEPAVLELLIEETRSAVCVVGSPEFFRSNVASRVTISMKVVSLGQVPYITGPGERGEAQDWTVNYPANIGLPRFDRPPGVLGAAVGRAMLRYSLPSDGPLRLHSQTRGLAWSAEFPPVLLVLDAEGRRVLREDGGEPLALDALPGPAETLQARPADGALTVSANGFLVTDVRQGGAITRVPDAFAWSPKGDMGLAAWRDGSWELWGKSGEVLRSAGAGPNLGLPTTLLVAWAHDGALAAISSASLLVVLDVGSGRIQRRVRWQDGEVQSIDWSPSGLLACGQDDGRVQLLDPRRADAPVLAGWTHGASGSGPTRVAFAPQPLDGRFDELCVAQGDRLRWLRVDPQALQPAEPQAASFEDDWLDTALAILQAMALAFHVGALGADDHSRVDVRAELAHWEGERRHALRTWIVMAEYVYQGPVQRVLVSGEDPLRHDPQQAREAYEQALRRWLGWIEERSDFRWSRFEVQWLRVAAELAAQVEPERFQALGGAVVMPYVQEVERLYEAAESGAEKPSAEELSWLAALEHEVAQWLQGESARELLARWCGPFFERFREDGVSSLARSAHYVEYLRGLQQVWHEAASELLRPPDPPARVRITFPTPTAHLEALRTRYPQLQVDPEPGTVEHRVGLREQALWFVDRRDYLALIESLGADVVRAVLQRLQLPPLHPRVLWVDEPDPGGWERQRLQDRGADIEEVVGTRPALEILAQRPVHLVVFVVARDSDAGVAEEVLQALDPGIGNLPLIVYDRPGVLGDEPLREHGVGEGRVLLQTADVHEFLEAASRVLRHAQPLPPPTPAPS